MHARKQGKQGKQGRPLNRKPCRKHKENVGQAHLCAIAPSASVERVRGSAPTTERVWRIPRIHTVSLRR